MKTQLLMGMLFLVPSLGWSLTSADISKIKSFEGSYELDENGMTKPQRKLCVEGDLDFDTDTGYLMLGATALATDVLTDEALKKRPKEEAVEGCQDRVSNKWDKDSLSFEMVTGCGSDMFTTVINRHISFQKESLVYTQKNKFKGELTEVTCKLRKNKSQKKEAPWKIEPEVEEVPTEPSPAPAKKGS